MSILQRFINLEVCEIRYDHRTNKILVADILTPFEFYLTKPEIEKLIQELTELKDKMI